MCLYVYEVVEVLFIFLYTPIADHQTPSGHKRRLLAQLTPTC